MAIYRGPGGANDGIPSSSSTEFPGDVNVAGNLHVNGDITSDGNIDGVHTGDGSGLTNLPSPDLSDVYTKTEIDAQQEAQDEAIQDVADAIDLIPAPVDSYTKTQTDTLLDNKANVGDSYTKAETYNNTEIDGKLFQKADKTNVYTKTEVDSQQSAQDTKIDKNKTDIAKNTSDIELLNGGLDSLTGAIIYKGDINVTATDAPVDPNNGDMYINNYNADEPDTEYPVTGWGTVATIKFNDRIIKTDTDWNVLSISSSSASTYTKAEIDTQQEAQDVEIAKKADKTDTYTKTEVDAIAGSGGIPEAPVDGKQYARKDANWSEVTGGTGGGGGATGAGGDEVFHENDLTVTTTYTLTTGKNAMSVGPISIASGATVTIPSGQRWVVL